MGDSVLERMRRCGADLFASGLITTRGGNLSVRVGDTIVITRTGALLAHLAPPDLVECPVGSSGERDDETSSDLVVHRAVYQACDARAVLHAHPPTAVAFTWTTDHFSPDDHEGRVFIPHVPVVAERKPRTLVASDVAAAVAAGARIVAVRTHGTYA